MLEEDDGLGFADFLASVQEDEKEREERKSKVKLSNTGFLNGKLYAIVNDDWLALYDGENLKLETNVPETIVDRWDLESLLEKEFESRTSSHPFVETLQNLNSCCEHDENFGVLITDDYNFKQIQEGDCAGWTLVYNRDKKIIAYMNWQACGCHVETIDDAFYNFLKYVTKKGAVYAGLDDPALVDGFNTEEFWETVEKILRLESEWVSGKRGKDNIHFFRYSEKEENAWRSEIVNDLSCGTICDERYYNSKDPIGFALRDLKSMAASNPKCLYRGKKLTRRLVKELLEIAEKSVTGD